MSGCPRAGQCAEDGSDGFAAGHKFKSPGMNCRHSISGASVSHQEQKTIDLLFREEDQPALCGLATRLAHGRCCSHLGPRTCGQTHLVELFIVPPYIRASPSLLPPFSWSSSDPLTPSCLSQALGMYRCCRINASVHCENVLLLLLIKRWLANN